MRKLIFELYSTNMISEEVAHKLLDELYNRKNGSYNLAYGQVFTNSINKMIMEELPIEYDSLTDVEITQQVNKAEESIRQSELLIKNLRQ